MVQVSSTNFCEVKLISSWANTSKFAGICTRLSMVKSILRLSGKLFSLILEIILASSSKVLSSSATTASSKLILCFAIPLSEALPKNERLEVISFFSSFISVGISMFESSCFEEKEESIKLASSIRASICSYKILSTS